MCILVSHDYICSGFFSFVLLFPCTTNISAVKNTLFTCVLKAHVLPLYFLHQNKCKFYIRLNAIFCTGINAIFTQNKCNFCTWINVFTFMYIYSNVKITLFMCINCLYSSVKVTHIYCNSITLEMCTCNVLPMYIFAVQFVIIEIVSLQCW